MYWFSVWSFFQEFWKGFGRNLKKEGRGDTSSRKEISMADYKKMLVHLVIVHKIMKADKNSAEYWSLVKQLAPEYQNKYNVLMTWGNLFIIMSATAKRAREGTYSFS